MSCIAPRINPACGRRGMRSRRLFAVQAGLTELWREWGIVPSAVVGHSAGEIAAAYAAGIFDLETGIRLAACRGRIMERTEGQGRMLSVAAGVDALLPLLRGSEDVIGIASINSPVNTVVSGDARAIDTLAVQLRSRGFACQPCWSTALFTPTRWTRAAGSFRKRSWGGCEPPTLRYRLFRQ